jgi:hypothetical protein
MACRPFQVVDKEGKNGVFLLCSKQEKINALIFLIFIDLHPSCLRQNGVCQQPQINGLQAISD